MKRFLVGLTIGLILGTVISVYASVARAIWVDGDEAAMGTSSNPVFITLQ